MGAITHQFVSAIPDGADTSVVRPSNWNADHSLVGIAQTDTANTFTGTQTVQKAVAATSTDGYVLETTTPATAGAQKLSPRVRWKANGWKTDAPAASQAVEFMVEAEPIQGTANPSGYWTIYSSINGGAYNFLLRIRSDGYLIPISSILNVAGIGNFSGGVISQAYVQAYTKLYLGSGADTVLERSAAGIVESNNGTTGVFRDVKLRNLLCGGGNGSYVQTPSMTVANLAVAATAGNGARAQVTDANTTLAAGLGTTVVGGGANIVPVYSDGTNWKIG